MFKNAVIGFLLSTILFMTETYKPTFNIGLYILIAGVFFFAVWVIEEKTNDLKRRIAFQRRFIKKVSEIKITPHTPTKAS